MSEERSGRPARDAKAGLRDDEDVRRRDPSGRPAAGRGRSAWERGVPVDEVPADAGAEAHSGRAPRGEEESLYWLALGPGIWTVHFLACYFTAAIWCAKAGPPEASLGPVPWLVLAYTVGALAGIGATAWHGFRRHRLGTAAVPHDYDTPQDRHRFLGFATLLLSLLSAVAVAYGGAVAFFFRSCS